MRGLLASTGLAGRAAGHDGATPPHAPGDGGAATGNAGAARRVARVLETLRERLLDLLRRPTAAITFDGDAVRVVVVRGRRVTAWGLVGAGAEPPTHPGDGASPQADPAESGLRSLLREMPMRRARVIASYPFNTSLTREFKLARVPPRYLAEVVHAEVMETLPFTSEEVDISWRARRRGPSTEVTAIAVPKDVADTYARRLREAGVRPEAVYARATALAFASQDRDAVVAAVEEGRANLVLVQDGAPVATYGTTTPRRPDQALEAAEVVARAATELAARGNAPDDANGKGHGVRVLLAGPDSLLSDLAPLLAEAMETPVTLVSPPLRWPAVFAAAEYSAAVGLVLADRSRAAIGRPRSTDRDPAINLLSERHRPRSIPRGFLAAMALAAAATSLMPVVVERVEAAEARASALAARVAMVEAAARRARIEAAYVAGVQERAEDAGAIEQALQGRLDSAAARLETLLEGVEATASLAAGRGVALSSVSLQDDGFAVAGAARSAGDVALYARDLRATGLFQGVRILRVEGGLPATARQGSGPGAPGPVTFHLRLVSTLGGALALRGPAE